MTNGNVRPGTFGAWCTTKLNTVPLPEATSNRIAASLVLPHRGHRRVLQGAVGPLLEAQFVRVDAVPEELGVPRGRGPHHACRRRDRRAPARGRLGRLSAGLNFMMRQIISATSSSCRPARDLLGDEEALAQRGLLRADHVGQFGCDADLFARPQVAVVGLLAVGGDDADIAGLVEQFEDLASGSSSARTPPSPIIVHTWIIAGGATMPG